MSETTAQTVQPVPESPRPSWYRRLYARVEAYSNTRYALAAFILVSIIDASVFPVPPFAIMVPMVLSKPRSWVKLAVLGTVASIGGGVIGYLLGHGLGSGAEALLHIDLSAPLHGRVAGWLSVEGMSVGEVLGKNFWFLALAASILPTPFKVVAIGSGVVKVAFGRFMLASVIGRSVRFFAVGGFLALFGERARKFLRV